MNFRLSTLLIVVTGLAVLFAQYASLARFALVAAIELALGVAWLAAKGRSFPWKLVFSAILASNLALFAYSCYLGLREQAGVVELLVSAFALAVFATHLLSLPICLLYLIFAGSRAVFRRGLTTTSDTPEPLKSSD